MSKRSIITISIVTGLLAVLLILFGAVFCVRNQRVSFVGDRSSITVTDSEIINTAKIKKGSPIFAIDKNEATKNIESAYPYLKVIQVKTASPITIEFRVRARVAMYYTQYNTNYLLLDEDLKVLQIVTDVPQLTKLNINTLGITESTVAGDFVGNANQHNIIYNLFTSMYNVGMLDDAPMDREDISSFMTEISFDTGYTLTKSYDRLIIKTSLGVTLDIAEPTDNLEYKVNVLMSAIDELSAEQKSSGTLKYYLTQDDIGKAGYFEADV